MNCNDRQFLGLDQATKMALSRRTFIKGSAGGIGLAALGSLMGTPGFAPLNFNASASCPQRSLIT